MWQKWWGRSPVVHDPARLREVVQSRLEAPPSAARARDVTRAANAWAHCAVLSGTPVAEVARQLDGWCDAFAERSAVALVRVGVRVHPATQLRIH